MLGFEELYETYFRQVYRFALSLCRDANMAEEITQRAFWNAFRHYADFEGRSHVTTWLCRIAKNEYLSLLRKRKPERLTDTAVEGAAPDAVEAALSDAWQAKAIQRIVHELDEPYKEVFLLRVYGEIPFSRISQLFGKSESWSRVTYYRAKTLIQDRIERMEEDGK